MRQGAFTVLAVAWLMAGGCSAGVPSPVLFDGTTLDGWEGDLDMFRVEAGAIVGGTLAEPIEQNSNLCTIRSFDDFELSLDARIEGSQNAGVFFRSERIPDSNEVGGYQADMGFLPSEFIPQLSDLERVDWDGDYPLWGSLLDEYRPIEDRYRSPIGPFWLLAVAEARQVEEVLDPTGWNTVVVRAVGPRIEISLSGVRTIEFVEDADVPSAGVICLQVHYGGPSIASYRNLAIRVID